MLRPQRFKQVIGRTVDTGFEGASRPQLVKQPHQQLRPRTGRSDVEPPLDMAQFDGPFRQLVRIDLR